MPRTRPTVGSTGCGSKLTRPDAGVPRLPPVAEAAMESAMKRYDVTGPFLVGKDKVPCYLTVPKTGIHPANNDKLLIQVGEIG